jgi:hypothetical protein
MLMPLLALCLRPLSPSRFAGFLAGLCLLFDVPSRRPALAVYCFCRAMYMLLRLAMRRGTIPRVPNLSTWLFAVANSPIMFAFTLEPALLDPVRVDRPLTSRACTAPACTRI